MIFLSGRYQRQAVVRRALTEPALHICAGSGKEGNVVSNKTLHRKNHRFEYLMSLPALAVLLVMTVYPVIFTVIYSFTNYNYLKQTHKFIGWKNYADIFGDPYFIQALLNTVKFTILAVVLEIAFGLLLSLFVNSLRRGQKIMRTILLLPYLLPAVTVALIFRMMLSPNYGIINKLLTAAGLPVFNWFYDTRTAFLMILLIDVWQNIPFAFLMIYARLQTVPKGQYEAAAIDGASAFQKFRYVTLPNIGSGIALCAMLRTIDSFRLFEKVNILTGGGPAGTTSTVTQYMYTYGIRTLKFGYGSAVSIVMTVIVLILSAVYIRQSLGDRL